MLESGHRPSADNDRFDLDFAKAREPVRPSSAEEMQEATDHVFETVEAALGRDASLEAFIEVTDDLDEAFFETADGALATRVLELASLDDDAFDERREEAERIIRQTASAAARLYPVIHRLQGVRFAPTREAVVDALEVGDVVKTVSVHGRPIVPVRRTLIGLLRDLDKRLATNVWSLEFAPTLPTTAVVSDPFDGNEITSRYWAGAIITARRENPSGEHSIYTVSRDKTAAVAGSLEHLAEQTDDAEVRDAAQTIVAFLDRTSVYYQNPDPRDFELYHLGMERPDVLMELMRSLDAIKHKDPELFLELLGINPEDGGRSSSFGSFLQKALFNTQRAIDRADGIENLAIRTMMRQLLTLDAHVQTYAGVVSQEALKAMATQIRGHVEAQPTAKDKAAALMMMAVPLGVAAVDAEVRRQLDALREANVENVGAELRRYIDDIDHPLKLMEYLGSLPTVAFEDTGVRATLKASLGIETDDQMVSLIRDRNPVMARFLYRRIPLVDETRDDLGYGRRFLAAVRDASALRGDILGVVTRSADSPRGKTAEQWLYNALERHGFEEDIAIAQQDLDSLKPSMSRTERDISATLKDLPPRIGIEWVRLTGNEKDRPFVVGQMLTERLLVTPSHTEIEIIREIGPDQVFLSVLSHPTKGPDAALRLFPTLSDLIPSDRLVEILSLNRTPVRKFNTLFDRPPTPIAKTYVKYLRDQLGLAPSSLPIMSPQWHGSLTLALGMEPAEYVDCLKKIATVLSEGKMPWMMEREFNEYKFNLWEILSSSKDRWPTYNENTPNIDDIVWGPAETRAVNANYFDSKMTYTVVYSSADGTETRLGFFRQPIGASQLSQVAKETTPSDPYYHTWIPLKTKNRP